MLYPTELRAASLSAIVLTNKMRSAPHFYFKQSYYRRNISWFTGAPQSINMARQHALAHQHQSTEALIPHDPYHSSTVAIHAFFQIACRPRTLSTTPSSRSLPSSGDAAKIQSRTVDALWSAIDQLLDRFGGAECRHYICHCG